MRYIEIIFESTGRTLYHGTLRQYVPSILKHGLRPTVGNFTRNAYQEYEDAGDELEDLVFAADKEGLNSCVSAIIGALKEAGIEDTVENFFRFGAICVIREGGDRLRHRTDDYDENHPTQVEPGDYYSEWHVGVDYVITGKKLRSLLKRNGIHVDRHGEDVDRGAAAARLIGYASKNNPEKRDEIIRTVRAMPYRKIRDLIHDYEMSRY